MTGKEGFSAGTKPILKKYPWEQERLWPFCTKEKPMQRGKTVPKSNGILSETEYLRNMVMEQILLEVIGSKIIC